MKMKKKLLNPQEGGAYVQISMKFRTYYFYMKFKQEKNFRYGGT